MNFLLATLVISLENLPAVFAGAIIAWVSGVSIHRRQSAAKKAAVLQSKLEAVVNESYKVHVWKRKIASAQRPIEPFPVEKMQALATLYFPEIDKMVTALALATCDYQEYLQKMLGEQQNKRLPPADGHSRLAELEHQIYDAQWALVEAVRAFALKNKLVGV